VLPETDAFCRILGLDPLGLISSGSLIVSVDVKDVVVLIGSLKDAGLPAVEIGRLTEPKEGSRIIRSGLESNMPEFSRDELARFFERQKL
jgi:hydrogenase maturation factor